jgi:hypothetical protein
MVKLRFITLMLAALGLAPGAAHVLELPVKMTYTPEFYAQVTSSLYALFGSVASVVQLGAFVSAAALAYTSRRSPEFMRVLLGAICLAVSLLLWTATVAPVNARWAHALQSAPDTASAVYATLRNRWEYGHVSAFIAWLVGYGALQWSACSRNYSTSAGRSQSRIRNEHYEAGHLRS